MKVFKSMNFKIVIFINNGLLFHIHISEEVKQSGVMALPEGRNSAEEASSSEPLLRPVAAELSELYRETTLHPGKKKKTMDQNSKVPSTDGRQRAGNHDRTDRVELQLSFFFLSRLMLLLWYFEICPRLM